MMHMKRLKNGTVAMELNQACKDKGYTMRANINPEYILLLKKCKQDSAAAIRAAIRKNDCMTVLREIKNAKHYNDMIREASVHHDKIVRDASGKVIFQWDYKKRKMYAILVD